MRRFLNYSLHFFIFLLLTLISQIGGIVYLLALFFASRIKLSFIGKRLLTFLVLYLAATFVFIPPLSRIFGRVPVSHTERIAPTNYMTVVLNRNYVKPELNEMLLEVSDQMNDGKTKIQIRYLDANFPFFEGFPLPPHLSHNDGEKIDLSFIYETPDGVVTNAKKSRSGYGVFVNPRPEETNHTLRCKIAGYFQYDFPKFFSFGAINEELIFSEKQTKKLVSLLTVNPKSGKLFIEPHLKQRLGLTNPKIRFQGCYSVRHDDHIHVQLK